MRLGRHRKIPTGVQEGGFDYTPDAAPGTLDQHMVTRNRAGQAPAQHFVSGQDGTPVSIPDSEPDGGLWNHGVRGEAVSSWGGLGVLRVTDPDAARDEFIARASERAQRTKTQREAVQAARESAFQLGLEQGAERELGRAAREAQAAALREEEKKLHTLRHPPFQAMIKRQGPATVVQLCTEGTREDGETDLMMATGISVCAPCDVYDRTIGTQIAYARAMKLMGEMLEQAAAARTRHVKDRY